MLTQSIKDVYFLANRFLCLPNTQIARFRFRRPVHPEGHYLHLGCGDDYIEGMINVDGNIRRRKNAWLDLRNRLPCRDESVHVLYCSHTLEHLFPDDAIRLLQEMRRVLSNDGIVRLAVPSFEHCLRIANGEIDSHWPRQFDDAMSQAINYIFCDGQHKYAYCFELIQRFASDAGFRRITNYSAESGVAEKPYGRVVLGNEPRGSLVVELQR